jgi:predicted naringenin-chalcone synthase
MYLGNFEIIRPKYSASQQHIVLWLARIHAQAEAKKQKTSQDPLFLKKIEEKLLSLGCGENKIQARGTELEDIFHDEDSQRSIYDLSENPQGKGFKERMRFYEQAVNSVFEKFYPEGCPAPPHLIHVSCTGYVSPSGAQHLVSQRNFGTQTVVSHAYHMGCYAAIPAIRMAQGYLSDFLETIDLVHTELCSLHMNPLFHETEQLVVQTLFADGFIKYSLLKKHGDFKILALHEEILPETSSCMSWRCEDWGMRMTLAAEIPLILRRALPLFVEKLQKKAGLKNGENLLFAIHPGGPKIIDQMKQSLCLSDEQVYHSQSILQEYGNMSSATLPHIWDRILKDKPSTATHILSLAFGPGLTVCGAIFKKEIGSS